MTWTKLSDTWDDHPKILMCSEPAQLLWIKSLTYANRHCTDGFISRNALSRLTSNRKPRDLARELVAAIPNGCTVGLWVEVEGGWQIHDFLVFNLSAHDVEERRRWEAERKAVQRRKHVPPVVPLGQSPESHKCPTGSPGLVPGFPSRPVRSDPDPDLCNLNPGVGGSDSLGGPGGEQSRTPAPPILKVNGSRTGTGAEKGKLTLIPDDFKGFKRQYEACLAADLDPDRELSRFVAYCKSKAVKSADFHAEFDLWISNGRRNHASA